MEADAQFTTVPRVYNGRQAALEAQVSRKTIQRWFRDGRLNADRTPSGELRISHDDLLQAKEGKQAGFQYKENVPETGQPKETVDKVENISQSRAENTRTQQGTSTPNRPSDFARKNDFEGHEGQMSKDWRTEATILERENERLKNEIERERERGMQEIKQLSFNTGRLTQENQSLKEELSLLVAPKEQPQKSESTQDIEGQGDIKEADNFTDNTEKNHQGETVGDTALKTEDSQTNEPVFHGNIQDVL